MKKYTLYVENEKREWDSTAVGVLKSEVNTDLKKNSLISDKFQILWNSKSKCYKSLWDYEKVFSSRA